LGVSSAAYSANVNEFIEAAKRGDLEAIELILKGGMDVNAKNAYDHTALMWAASEGHPELVAFLIEQGADIRIKYPGGSTVLMLACRSGNMEIVQLLLQEGADINAVGEEYGGSTPLMEAARKGYFELVTFLINSGADPLLRTKGDTPLIAAASGGYTDVARMLIELGVDINATAGHYGITAIIQAADHGHTEYVKLLVEHGADVTMATSNGITALYRAAQHGRLEIAEILIENGADVNARFSTGRSILMEAAGGGHLEVVILLLENGADVNSRTKGGHTVLMEAVSSGKGHVEVVKTLLRYGADVNAIRYDDETALSMAREKLHAEEMVKILLKAGAEGPPEEVDSLSAVERATIIADNIDSLEAGDKTAISPKRSDLECAAARLTAHLESNPDDVQALILFARIGRATSIATPHVFSKDSEKTVSDDEYSPLLAALDRALALQPDNAEAFYWKARLYGTRLPDLSSGRVAYRTIDIEGAIAMSRRAVELKPDNVAYREALALYLLATQQLKEAMEVLANVADGLHPIYLLLKDMEAVPIPENAIFSPEDSHTMAELFIQAKYGNLRVRCYVLPMSATEVEAFYADHWEMFELFPIDADRPGYFGTHLKEKDGTLTPATRAPEPDEALEGGIGLGVFEFSGVQSADGLKSPFGHPLPTDLGDVYCFLTILNYRSFE
jgi:ankyrin repeat protein/cytochrome c-type biogenesis protein CcmH/NrfG